jgi:predicted phosphodiesterase
MNTTPWTKIEVNLLEKLTKEGKTAHDVAGLLGRSYNAVETQARRRGLTRASVAINLPKLDPPKFGRLPLEVINSGDWITFGLVADTHLACREERLAELHMQYDLFKAEGITQVFHAGNLVDGYVPRINGSSVYETSIDGQCQYAIDNYPAREGILTYFITGDDHEAWWMKEGFNFGGYLMYMAKDQGRNDLQYIGHVEADVEVKVKGAKRSTIIKIQHPGGGSAYARSYAGQKQVESWEGGEKPDILVQGHFHTSNYMNERNVHVIDLPGFKDQDIFARKKRLRTEVGGAILSFKVNPKDGSVTRCRVEIDRYFTRGYYKTFLRSDAKILKGHLVLTP